RGGRLDYSTGRGTTHVRDGGFNGRLGGGHGLFGRLGAGPDGGGGITHRPPLRVGVGGVGHGHTQVQRRTKATQRGQGLNGRVVHGFGRGGDRLVGGGDLGLHRATGKVLHDVDGDDLVTTV